MIDSHENLNKESDLKKENILTGDMFLFKKEIDSTLENNSNKQSKLNFY